MSSTHRSFANKISKVQASDVRRQVIVQSLSNDGTLRASTPLLTTNSNASGNATNAENISNSSSRLSLTSGVSFYDVVEPVDFEEAVSHGRGGGIGLDTAAGVGAAGGSPRRLQDFPNDDIQVKTCQREQNTIETPIDPDTEWDKLDSATRDIIETYQSDLALVQRRYSGFSTGESYIRQCTERQILPQTLNRQNFEVDLVETSKPIEETVISPFAFPVLFQAELELLALKKGRNIEQTICTTWVSQRASYASHHSSESTNSTGGDSGSTAVTSNNNLEQSVGDPILPAVAERTSPDSVDATNEHRRKAGRHSNIMRLFPLQHEEEVIERRSPPPFPSEHSGSKLLVRIVNLNLESSFEPIFASMALYDVKEKKKLSEEFYFDCNPNGIKAMLKTHIPFQDASTLSKSAIFSVTYPTPDIQLLVKDETEVSSRRNSIRLDPAAGASDSCKRPHVEQLKTSNDTIRFGCYNKKFVYCNTFPSDVITQLSMKFLTDI